MHLCQFIGRVYKRLSLSPPRARLETIGNLISIVSCGRVCAERRYTDEGDDGAAGRQGRQPAAQWQRPRPGRRRLVNDRTTQ